MMDSETEEIGAELEGAVSLAESHLFTPATRRRRRAAVAGAEGRRLDFSGFSQQGEQRYRRMYDLENEGSSPSENVLHRKVCDLEWSLKKALLRLNQVEKKQEI